MAQNISGFGFQVVLTSNSTFLIPTILTQFADDADPMAATDQQVADSAMGLNGDKVNWSVAKKIEIKLSVIAETPDDRSLAILLEANRPGRNKKVAYDNIQMVLNYPSGRIVTLTNGSIEVGAPMPTIQSAGRYKGNTYQFSFENAVNVWTN